MTHRQIGISEAFMKILPEMRFKDSNIGTEFLPLGKREDMSRYIVRADEEFAYNNALFAKEKAFITRNLIGSTNISEKERHWKI